MIKLMSFFADKEGLLKDNFFGFLSFKAKNNTRNGKKDIKNARITLNNSVISGSLKRLVAVSLLIPKIAQI